MKNRRRKVDRPLVSCEAFEQSRRAGGGEDGAKGSGQRETETWENTHHGRQPDLNSFRGLITSLPVPCQRFGLALASTAALTRGGYGG